MYCCLLWIELFNFMVDLVLFMNVMFSFIDVGLFGMDFNLVIFFIISVS